MALANQDTSVMNTLRQAQLVDTSLQSALQEILDFERQHVIELHTGLIKHADTHETADQGIAFEKTFGVFFVECEKLTGILELALG